MSRVVADAPGNPGTHIALDAQPAHVPGATVLFFTASGVLDSLPAALAADPTVCDPLLVADYGDEHVYRVVVTPKALLVAQKVAELDIHLLDVESDGLGWCFRMLLPDRDALAQFKEYCDANGISFGVRTMYRKEEKQTKGGFGLTDAQRSALVLARERGYFDDPRTVSLAELAAEADVSPSAMGRRIRRATGALVDAMLSQQQEEFP
ncbi:helix-turn-helix domain-containing protein [Haloarculaceae archaeon H-GB11]|nr:helix-turn-helix domain-containing protein [Haloarculaceae archaeon H-GB11]